MKGEHQCTRNIGILVAAETALSSGRLSIVRSAIGYQGFPPGWQDTHSGPSVQCCWV